ncbi:hypothetical protein [Mycobacterium sp.]|uniref:hypothetical protein n=1 Tax=Mycobacterium sp. TaxID=1785 RepID=UPI0025DB5F75|nr:hypothetical protein [Mycobacterium sp.]
MVATRFARLDLQWRPASPGSDLQWRPAAPGYAAFAIATAALAIATAALTIAT